MRAKPKLPLAFGLVIIRDVESVESSKSAYIEGHLTQLL